MDFGLLRRAGLLLPAGNCVSREGVWVVQEDCARAKSSVEVQEGIFFHEGYLADEFANDPQTGNCVFEHCLVVVYDGKIHSNQQLLPLLGETGEAKKPVLILAEAIEAEALKLLVYNNKLGKLSCFPVKAPGYQGKIGFGILPLSPVRISWVAIMVGALKTSLCQQRDGKGIPGSSGHLR